MFERTRRKVSERLCVQSVQEQPTGSLTSCISRKGAQWAVVQMVCPQGPVEDCFKAGFEESDAEASIRVIVRRSDKSD